MLLCTQEDAEIAKRYKERSVAEQKSLDLGLGRLMEDRFSELLATICPTDEEKERFRALVINQVMATGKLLFRNNPAALERCLV